MRLKLGICGKNSTEMMLCSFWCIISGFRMLLCLITGEISHDQLVKVLSTSYLHSKVTIFPLYKEYIFGGETLRLCEYLVSPQVLPVNFGIYWGFAYSNCCSGVRMVNFDFPLYLSHP